MEFLSIFPVILPEKWWWDGVFWSGGWQVSVCVCFSKMKREKMKERKERADQKREEMWVKLSGWEWWVVGLGGGTRGPQNADLHFFFFFFKLTICYTCFGSRCIIFIFISIKLYFFYQIIIIIIIKEKKRIDWSWGGGGQIGL